MKQEDKELLLLDLCSRLPYGVNVEYTFKVTVIATNTEKIKTKSLFLYSINTLDNITVSGIDDDGDETICFLEEVKPYLFPLSSMSEGQKREYNSLCIEEEREQLEFGEWVTRVYYHNTIESIDWLNKHHFDYRGLIEKELAIDASNLNVY